jgi:hypothetical protein
MEDLIKSIYDKLELIKGRRSDPVGTVRNGQVKVAEGTWRPVGEKKKKRRPGEGGGQKRPAGKPNDNNPFAGKSPAYLKKKRAQIKMLSEKFKGDGDKMAALKKMSSQISAALKSKKK